jgi:3-oxoadipate enol-lactonase
MTAFVPVPGGRLAYDVTGDGPPIVLMHAWICDRRMWDDLVPLFARRHRVIRYDKRGYGETEVAERVRYSNRADVIAVLDQLGIDRAALIGVSGGSVVALDTALEYPDRIAALVCVAPGISGFDGGDTEGESAAFTQLEKLEEAGDWPALVEGEIAMWVDGLGQPPERITAVRDRVRVMDLDAYTRHADEPLDDVIPLEPRATGRLASVATPTLVVVGDLDTSGTVVSARRIGSEVPGAQLVEWKGVAHLPPMERPLEFVQLVETFLDGARG